MVCVGTFWNTFSETIVWDVLVRSVWSEPLQKLLWLEVSVVGVSFAIERL